MRPFTFLFFLAIVAALPHSQAAPVPKRTNAKPAVIDAGTEQYAQSVKLRLVSLAHIAILEDKTISEMAIVRQRLHDPKDTRELISWLEKNFSVERVKGTNLIRASFKDGNAKEQAAIINVVVDHYLKTMVDNPRESTKKMFEILKQKFEERRRAGKVTAEQAAKAEEEFKAREEYIRILPALVEHAKVP